MALTTAIISFDLADQVGANIDPRRTKIWVSTNIPEDTVVDTESGTIRLGTGNVGIDDAGHVAASVWVPGATSNPASWQTYINVDYPDRNAPTGRNLKVFGPFTVVANALLAELIQEQDIPPTYLSEVAGALQDLLDEAEVTLTAAQTFAQGEYVNRRWRSNTAYTIGTVVLSPFGELVQALSTFTSGTTYDPIMWTTLNGAVDLATLPVVTSLATTDYLPVSAGAVASRISYPNAFPLARGQVLRSGQYVGFNSTATNTTGALVVNTLYLKPLPIRTGGTLNEVRVRVFGAGGAGSVVRLGLYAQDSTTGLVGTKIADWGTVDTSSTGIKTITISQAVTDSTIYWLAAVAQVGTTPTLFANTSWTDPLIPSNGSPDTPSGVGMTATAVSGALPTTITTMVAGGNGTFPAMTLKAA